MTDRSHIALGLLLLAISSCGPSSAEEGTSSVERPLETACSEFCSVATECSTLYVDDWLGMPQFESRDQCESACVAKSEASSKPDERPHCRELYISYWECAGTIEGCDDYNSFEQGSFGEPGFPDFQCQDELVALVQGTCT